MELNLLERIKLLEILPFPSEGSALTLTIFNDLRLKLSPSEKEFKEYKIETRNEKVFWNAKGSEFREIKIGEKAKEIVVDTLKKFEKKEKLPSPLLRIHLKYVDKEK